MNFVWGNRSFSLEVKGKGVGILVVFFLFFGVLGDGSRVVDVMYDFGKVFCFCGFLIFFF